ncbi:hypothetical protein, partial [Microvirga massiliensis]|uniref:hypothetical protein n=1 Tax=Microvirga massiliensis TaxID=1033741 RepID=UPI0018CFC7F2
MAEDWKEKLRKAFFGKKSEGSKASAKRDAATKLSPAAETKPPRKVEKAEKPGREKPASSPAAGSSRSTSPAATVASGSSKRIMAPEVDAHIGIDFGTRFTKVALHLPHVQSRKVLPLGQPAERILASKLFVDAGRLIYPPDLAPASTEGCIEYLKMRLASPQGKTFGSVSPLAEAEDPTVLRALSATYLAGIIRMAMKAARREPALGPTRPVAWLINVGVPVKHCDSPEISVFQEVCG